MNGHRPTTPTDPIADHGGQSLVEELLQIIGDAEPASHDERRARPRFPIFSTLKMTPIDSAGRLVTEEETTITGKDLSANGISFSHDSRITHRRVVIALIHPRIVPFYVEAEITWTRETPIGLHESGCHLIRKLTSPSAAAR
jgi:hypothetical protein